MANSTWVKIDRNILKWRWYQDANTARVFLHLILTANIEDHDFQKITVHRGEVVTSLASLSRQLRVSIKSVRTALDHLKSTGEVASTAYNKFQVISIINYDLYQAVGASRTASNGQAAGKQTAGKGQQSKNIRSKEVKNEKNVCVPHTPPSAATHKTPTANEVAAYFAARGRSQQDAEKFFAYNQARGWMVGRTRITDWVPVADMWIAGNADAQQVNDPNYDPHPELYDFGRPIKPEYQ